MDCVPGLLSRHIFFYLGKIQKKIPAGEHSGRAQRVLCSVDLSTEPLQVSHHAHQVLQTRIHMWRLHQQFHLTQRVSQFIASLLRESDSLLSPWDTTRPAA